MDVWDVDIAAVSRVNSNSAIDLGQKRISNSDLTETTLNWTIVTPVHNNSGQVLAITADKPLDIGEVVSIRIDYTAAGVIALSWMTKD